MATSTVDFFCAWEMKVTQHTLEHASNGDLVLTCDTPGCHHVHKLPAEAEPELATYSTLYRKGNAGHTPVLPEAAQE
jgi:hypothetical protein